MDSIELSRFYVTSYAEIEITLSDLLDFIVCSWICVCDKDTVF